ncbi:hypothetical protein [Methylotuvimicrobium sp. KM2]|uniref:hypothetical protein n=1 Tax=Methylotuvimicrobium sp. KM2 TaxID=3133976 RepID=UPI0031012C9E
MKCRQCNFEMENLQVCPQCGATSEQPPTQAWHWQNNKPPGPITIAAGKVLQFRLPLNGNTAPPRCQWTGLPGKAPNDPVFSDDLTLEIVIPEDATGIHKINYALAGYESLNGSLRLKVIPKQQLAANPETGVSKKPDSAETSTPQPSEIPEKKPDLVTKNSTSPTPPETEAQKPAQTVPSDNVKPAETSKPETNTPNPALPAIDPHSGLVYVQVYRGNMPISQLKTKLDYHQSLLVGKRSESKNIFPQIDLKSHFPDSRSASFCSRQQAKIYWSQGHVFIRNLGASPLRVNNNRVIDKDEDYNWPLNETVELPGGLVLRLTFEAAG